ncbi:MAG TPA: 6,7-dimethyl-8-ribityllumazine synthase [Puia sp.]|jgi:6,7-dimethyl-8-ribityllumazine synthase
MAEITNSKLLKTTGVLKQDACVVVVRTEWNAAIVDELEKGCKKKLSELSVKKIQIITVPGAFEISFAVKKYWEKNKKAKNKPDAFIALGCVLRGDTPHFDYVCKAVTDGIVQLNLMLPVPTIFGVLTVDNQQQADERIGGKHGHKGEEAAVTALKMIALFSKEKLRVKK